MNETPPAADNGSPLAYGRQGLIPGAIAGLVAGPCATFCPYLLFGGQAADSFAFLFVWGTCLVFGLLIGPIGGISGGFVGAVAGKTLASSLDVRVSSAVGGAVATTVINVVVTLILIFANLI